MIKFRTNILLLVLMNAALINAQKEKFELPKDSVEIKGNFEVLSFDKGNYSSISLSPTFTSYSFFLKHDSLDSFVKIQYYANSWFYPGILYLINKIPELKKTVINSYPYKYALNHPSNVQIRIEFINKSSITKKAKRNLYKYLRKTKIKTKIPDLEDAIMIVTVENDDWQVWIVLKNGDSLLWYFKGDRVLGIDKKNLSTQILNTYSHSYQIFNTDGNQIINE
jgi:hypothetical protein